MKFKRGDKVKLIPLNEIFDGEDYTLAWARFWEMKKNTIFTIRRIQGPDIILEYPNGDVVKNQRDGVADGVFFERELNKINIPTLDEDLFTL